MTDSVSKAISLQHRMFGSSVNKEKKMKRSRPNMEYHPEIYVEMLRKTTKKAQDDQCPG